MSESPRFLPLDRPAPDQPLPPAEDYDHHRFGTSTGPPRYFYPSPSFPPAEDYDHHRFGTSTGPPRYFYPSPSFRYAFVDDRPGAGRGPHRDPFPQRGLTMDLAKGSIAVAVATGVAIFGALKAGGYTHGLGAASVLVLINLGIGVHVSSAGRRHHRTLASVNFCACLVALTIALAYGGDLEPQLVKKIYDALF